jgi:hypothetical protein
MPHVTLLQPHTHAGRDYATGDSLDVSEFERAWLVRHGVIAPEPSPLAATLHTETSSGDDHAAN